MRGPGLRSIAALAALGALATSAEAHQTSIKYVDVTVEGRRAAVSVTVAPSDVTEPLGQPPDARPQVAEAIAPAVAAYVARWLAIAPDPGEPCPAGPARALAGADARFVVVTWEVACAADLARLALDFRAFF